MQLEEAQRQHEADLTEADHALTALQETIDDKAERVADLEHVLAQIQCVIAQKDSSIDEAGTANAVLQQELESQQANLDEALAMLAEVREEGLVGGDWQMQSEVRGFQPFSVSGLAKRWQLANCVGLFVGAHTVLTSCHSRPESSEHVCCEDGH